MPDEIARRRPLLTTGLVGAPLPKDVPEGHIVGAWLDSWAGVGHVVERMHDAGYNVRLSQSPFVWWAAGTKGQPPCPGGLGGPATKRPGVRCSGRSGGFADHEEGVRHATSW